VGRRYSVPDKTSRSDAFEEIDAHIERQMERPNTLGAALAIVQDDESVHLRDFDPAHFGGEAPTLQTPFVPIFDEVMLNLAPIVAAVAPGLAPSIVSTALAHGARRRTGPNEARSMS
jgi:hypothetical protein